jgi:hypothetical protein
MKDLVLARYKSNVNFKFTLKYQDYRIKQILEEILAHE